MADFSAPEGERDRSGWPWVAGAAPADPAVAGDDDRGDWVPPSKRRFWSTKTTQVHTEPVVAEVPVATVEASQASELPAVLDADEEEHHTSIVEALAELETRNLDEPKKRHRRRKERKALLHDHATEELAAMAAAEVRASDSSDAEVPASSAAAFALAPREPAPPKRRWWSRRARAEEEAAWEAGRPTWPWISHAPEAEAQVATEQASANAAEEPAVAETEVVSEAAASAAEPEVVEPAAREVEAPVVAEAPIAAPPVVEPAHPAPDSAPEQPEEKVAAAAAAGAGIAAAAEAPEHAAAEAQPADVTQPVPFDEETPRNRAQRRREAALAGAGVAAGGAGLAAMVHEEEEEDGPSRWAWLGTKRVAAVILVLLAAEIGYVVHLNTQGTSNKTASPPTTQFTVPTPTTAPNLQVPVVVPTTVPTTVPASTPTTVAKPAPKPAVAAVQAAPLAPCTTSDLSVVTTETGATVPSGAFAVGTPITVTTTVSAVRSCIFQPAAVQPQNCPTWIVVNALDGPGPGFPNTTSTEACSPPAGQTMNPGSSESVSISWTPTTVGTYQAAGTWGWSSQSGAPYQETGAGPRFAVSNS